MYTIRLTTSAQNHLKKINENTKRKIVIIFDTIENNGFLKVHNITKLKGRNNEFRLKLGYYRLLFRLNKNNCEITVLSILSRKKAYK